MGKIIGYIKNYPCLMITDKRVVIFALRQKTVVYGMCHRLLIILVKLFAGFVGGVGIMGFYGQGGQGGQWG